VTACVEVEALLAERASGELPLEEAARLEEHLPGCSRCRAELAAYDDVFALVRESPSPRPSPRMRGEGDQTLQGDSTDLAKSTLALWKLRQRQRKTALALGAGFLAAAAAALFALSPALLGPRTQHALPATAVATAWEPDVDGVVEASAILDSASSDTSDSISTEDAVLAALDAADGL